MPHVTFSTLGNHGQFGNQLFQIATVLGYAKRFGSEPIFPKWSCGVSGRDYGALFPAIKKYYGEAGGLVVQEPAFTYRDLPFVMDADLRGDFQCEKYFANVKDQVRELFAEPPYIKERLDEYCEKNALGSFNAMHFRFYRHREKDWPTDGEHPYLKSLPDTYFLEAARRLGGQGPIVVAADNKPVLEEFRRRTGIAHALHILSFEDSLLDFYMLSRAQKIAISNSSFSWWAAYLGNPDKEIFAPPRTIWFHGDHSIHPRYNSGATGDLYPANFIELQPDAA